MEGASAYFVLVVGCRRFSLIQEINMEELNSANSEFCFKRYKEIAKSKKHENIFFSPLSIMSAMGMVYRGASGNTATQMGEVFLFHKVGKMVSYGESTPDTTCPGMEQQALKTHYQVPFPKRAHLDEDVDTLNILPAFKALYAVINKPSSNYTLETATNMYVEKTYQVKKTSKKPVQMMFKRAKFNIAQVEEPGLAFKVLELPYVNKDLSMIILLPNEILDDSTGLEKLERGMTNDNVSKWTNSDNMENTTVELFLPKFKMEESYDLKQTLSTMGMSDAFSQGSADFSGMSAKLDLYLSNVFFKAFVEVNEEGTEAAAATAAVVTMRTAPISVSFEANHPFLFLIRHNKTGSILFWGRFCSP
ncbi:serpin B10-like [Pleurodeles waltl]|uniref:serpin B10-like n=1 Tax=Pleurodeles waltl TaxID=8319 RepID=UPI003709744D